MRYISDSDSGISRFDKLGQVSIYCFLSIIVIMLIFAVVTRNRGKCLYAVWHNISFITLIHWIPLINIDNNSEFESFFSQIAIVFRPFELPSICLDEPIDNHIYSSIKIKSNSFINNAKESLLVYFSILLACIIVIILSKYTNSNTILYLKKQVKYSIIIRLHLLFYLDFMTFSLINLYFYTGKNACSSMNLGFSLFFLIMGGCWIIAIPLIIKKKITGDIESHHDIVFESIETIVKEFKPCFTTSKYQFYTIFLFYRYSLAFCLVVLPNSPSIQLFMIALFQFFIGSLYLVLYVCITRPFAMKFDAITVVISEFLCLFLVVLIGIRSLDDLTSNMKYYLTFGCVLIIWVTEITIIVRFILDFVLFKKTSLDTLANETQGPTVVPIESQVMDDKILSPVKRTEISIDCLSNMDFNDHAKSERVVNTNYISNPPHHIPSNYPSHLNPPKAIISNNNKKFDLNSFTVAKKVTKEY
ncbi:hypothetical protein SteCoe_26661 [Stentor coeruleus]|uniref:Uncharacterized protein n=1 Tax=Stentor coeruleus TaxID=5963 RepID=A0A1R2BCN3_9CILI|nr:hypothetical protein SteCoe_26661 [Stentor coeruleus]